MVIDELPDHATHALNSTLHLDEPKLLRVPQSFHSVGDVLECARKMDLPNVVILSELENGNLVFLETDMSVASANWMLDRMKFLLLSPSAHERLPG